MARTANPFENLVSISEGTRVWELMMRIAVVGSGYVGLVAGACFADLGHEVVLVDNDAHKLALSTAARFPSTKNSFPHCWPGIAAIG